MTYCCRKPGSVGNVCYPNNTASWVGHRLATSSEHSYSLVTGHPVLAARPSTASAAERLWAPDKPPATPSYGPIPTPRGWLPTGMGVRTTALVVVSITVTLLLSWLAT